MCMISLLWKLGILLLFCFLILIKFDASFAQNGCWVSIGSQEACGSFCEISPSSWIVDYPKIEWRYRLCLKQYFTGAFNPFKNYSVKSCSWNACAAEYYITIGWVDIPITDPRFTSNIGQYYSWAVYDTDGITIISPSVLIQSVNSGGYLYSENRTYNHDTTAPTCSWSVILNHDEDGSEFQTTYTGWWTNTWVWAKAPCKDTVSWLPESEVSWCYWNRVFNGVVYSSELQVAHKQLSISPTLTDKTVTAPNASSWLVCPLIVTTQAYCYEDVVLGNTCLPANTFQVTPLIDLRLPTVQITVNNNIIGSSTSGVFSLDDNFLASDKFIIKVSDEPTPSFWVSGLKSVSWVLRLTEDINWNPLDTIVCEFSYLNSVNTFNPAWTNDIDTDVLTHDCTSSWGIKLAGKYNFKLLAVDFAGNITDIDTNFDSHPNNILHAEIINRVGTWIYADAMDYFVYTIRLLDTYNNPIINKEVFNLLHASWAGVKTLFLDGISNTGEESLLFYFSGFYFTWALNSSGITQILVSSFSPGDFSESFELSMTWWNRDYTNTGILWKIPLGSVSNIASFIKLFTGQILLDTDMIRFWLIQWVFLPIAPQLPIYNSILYTITGFIDTFVPLDSWFQITSRNEFTSTSWTLLLEQLSSEITRYGLESFPIIRYPLISRELQSKYTKYYLTYQNNDFSSWILFESGLINRIFIEWNKQSYWKEGFISTDENLWSVKGFSIRSEIRKNATTLIRWLENGEVVNNIKYIEWDYILEWVPNDWDTLIIKNWNLQIKDNFNTINKNVGIILISDDASSPGNIYIYPNVAYIAAILYTDWSIMSVDIHGDRFPFSNAYRTNTLDHQIVFFGSVFSRNTIWWAVLWWDTGSDLYFLPGQVVTDNLHKAVEYDLSFLRMKNIWWNSALWSSLYNNWRNEAVVIIHNPIISNNPPTWFTIIK